MVKPTIKTIFVANQFAVGVWLLMKTLACNGSFLEFWHWCDLCYKPWNILYVSIQSDLAVMMFSNL